MRYCRQTLGLQSPACTVALALNPAHASVPRGVLSACDSLQRALSQVLLLRNCPV